MLIFQIIRALNRNFVTTAMSKKAAFDDRIMVENKTSGLSYFGVEGNN